MVSVFGTMCADVAHVGLGIAYTVSTSAFAVVLAAIFSVWYRVEHTLSIHSITTARRELFYWAAVTTTFALGTAAGDMTAVTLHRGYFSAGLIFTAIFVVPGLAYRFAGAQRRRGVLDQLRPDPATRRLLRRLARRLSRARRTQLGSGQRRSGIRARHRRRRRRSWHAPRGRAAGSSPIG